MSKQNVFFKKDEASLEKYYILLPKSCKQLRYLSTDEWIRVGLEHSGVLRSFKEE